MTLSIWNDLLVPGIPYLEKALRTLLVYVAVLLGLKLAGKRELSQLNPFDLVVLLLLSNTVQNAIIGNDNSVVGGLFGAAVLLLTNHFWFATCSSQAGSTGWRVVPTCSSPKAEFCATASTGK